jgi:hypothetical protein
MRDPAKLFLVALVGVLAMIGLALSALGPWVVSVYGLVVLVVGVLMVKRSRKAAAHSAAHSDGRTCTCCTTTVFDPIEVK